MAFHFNSYSTPLLFGFVQGWIYAMLLWVRGWREERLSDRLLGWVLVGCCLNIWEYMLGFGGIEILWRELEFFPRTLGYLLPPLCYFYLKSQVNADFRFSRRDARHAVPFLLFTVYHVGIFAQGPTFVARWEATVHYSYHISDLEFVIGVGLDIFYLLLALRLYRQYRAWIKTQFSETEAISFRWFRNFLIALTITTIVSLAMSLLSIALDLTYWQDWWGQLVGVVLIYYISINGYAQAQPTRRLTFQTDSRDLYSASQLPDHEPAMVDEAYPVSAVPATKMKPVTTSMAAELLPLLNTLLTYMDTDAPYLEPELSLADLARRLHTNPVLLSQVMNAGVGKNFNDFVNEYRVNAFKQQVRMPANAHLSLLGLALNCGFNSKATFNRAFKKCTGMSPKAYAEN